MESVQKESYITWAANFSTVLHLLKHAANQITSAARNYV